MFELKPLAVAVQRVLSTVAIVLTSTAPTVGQAQEETLEEVVVTGTRIPIDPNLSTSSPVTMIKSEELGHRGITRVEDLLNDLPSITYENTANDANGAIGTATVDLRGLTSDRTLVLTNGHRMGFGDVFDLAPDINQVPGTMIERIEVLTGGASSTYGSDAIAGVVNFIMKQDFEGLQVDYQYSAYQHDQGNAAVQAAVAAAGYDQAPDSVWDGGGHDINVTMGVNSADGKGNITAYLGYRQFNAVTMSERDFSACELDLFETVPGEVCGGDATIPTGLFTPFDGTGAFFTVAGDQFVPWDFTFFNFAPNVHFQRPDERYTAGFFAHYEVNEHFEGYAEFQFMDDRTNAQIAPSGAFFVTSSLNCDNPLISAQQSAAIGCTAADITAGTSVPLFIGRRNVEGGSRNDDINHTSFRLLFGARGDINEDWRYDAFVNVSRTDLSELYSNDLSTTRITRALAVVPGPGGVPTCRSVIDGSDPTCVPWNIFETGGVTQAQVNYISIDLFSKGDLKQDQYIGFVSGDLTGLGLVSPMSEDGVEIVIGGEYRDEGMDYKPSEGYTSGDAAGQTGPTPAVAGDIHVAELFLEARLPLVQNQDWIESLTLDVGYRYSDYSGGKTTDTYKAQGEWTPVRGFKLRGGYSRAVRTANIRELFRPRTSSEWFGLDPCEGAAPMQTLAQCQNSGVTAAQYGSIPANFLGFYNNVLGGNVDLAPEKSNSFTVGAVIEPKNLVPGLKLSVDYWRIEVKDAIGTMDSQFIVDQCGLSGDPAFCSLVNRAPNGTLGFGNGHVEETNVNIGFFETAGIDIFASYTREVGNYGALDFVFRGTWMEKYDQQFAPGVVVEDCAGLYFLNCGRARPTWRHNLAVVWSTPWDLSLAGTWRHIDGVDPSNPADFAFFGLDPDEFSVSSENYLDLALDYSPRWIRFDETTLSMGVSNVMDNDPPIIKASEGNTIAGMWDPLGRYFFFKITQKF
jgi:iron complex outermembrane recepter protein